MDYLLSLVIFFPSFGAIILCIFLRAENFESNKNAKLLSLVTTFATFIFSLFVIYNFDSDYSGFQLVEEYEWLMGLTYKVGIDGIINYISLTFIPNLTRFVGRLQTGLIYHYAFAIFIGLVSILTYFLVSMGG